MLDWADGEIQEWANRERRTARLVRACYDICASRGALSADELHALCRLTWITKNRHREITDNTGAVVEALSDLGFDPKAGLALMKGFQTNGAPDAIGELGIVAYYNGFRRIAREWLCDHRDAVRKIVDSVASAVDDGAANAAYRKIESLPLLSRPRAGDGKPSNLLTPLLACLDPRSRAPIINARTRQFLRRLDPASLTLGAQYDGLVNLIGQAGIDDAFDLDAVIQHDDLHDDLLERIGQAGIDDALDLDVIDEEQIANPPKELGERNDEDVEYLRSMDMVTMRRTHNTMTNAFRAICKQAGLIVQEGSERTCRFDALILEYRNGRHLLVEVKTNDAMPMCRMAVGQLLDYRRRQSNRVAIDLAVLFPTRPSQESQEFLADADVGVKAIWFNEDFKKIEGSIELGGCR